MTQTEWLDAVLDRVGADLTRADIPRIKQAAIALDDEHYHMLAEDAVGATLVDRLKSRQRSRTRSVRSEVKASQGSERSLPGIDLSAYDMPAERLMRETLRLHDQTVIEAHAAGPDAEAAMRQWAAENAPGAKTTLARCRLVRDTADVMTLRREALGRDVSAAEVWGWTQEQAA